MLADINRIYRYCNTYALTVHEVYDRSLYQFSDALRKFQAMLYASEQAEVWKVFTGGLKRYRYLLSSSPLPPNSIFLDPDSISRRLHEFLDLQKTGTDENNEIITRAGDLFSLFHTVSSENINKLYMKLESVFNRDETSDAAVVLLENHLVEPVKDYLRRKFVNKNPDVFSVHELKGIQSYKRIFFFGSPCWLENRGCAFLLTAPRSSIFDIISYTWIKNKIKQKTCFDTAQEDTKKAVIDKIKFMKDDSPESLEIEDAELFMPGIDIAALKKRMEKTAPDGGSDDTEDTVDARIIILAGDKAVFVEAGKDSSSFVLNFAGGCEEEDFKEDSSGLEVEDEEEDSENDNLLGRHPNDDLQEGMFLLLRTGGGGDFIVDIANKILGNKRSSCREMQRHWKNLFKSKIITFGVEKIRQKIIQNGGSKVQSITILNWAKERNIRPGTHENFAALLKIVDLGNEFNKYNQNAELILTAHRKAGRHIRGLLLKQIKKSDLNILRDQGVMVFHLPDIDTSAGMTAFRIERVLSDIHEVHFHKLGHPVDIGEESWL